MASEITIPHRSDPLSTEEAVRVITEGLQLVHMLIGSYCKDLPDEMVARAHKFFSVQAVRLEDRDRGCRCSRCIACFGETGCSQP